MGNQFRFETILVLRISLSFLHQKHLKSNKKVLVDRCCKVLVCISQRGFCTLFLSCNSINTWATCTWTIIVPTIQITLYAIIYNTKVFCFVLFQFTNFIYKFKFFYIIFTSSFHTKILFFLLEVKF